MDDVGRELRRLRCKAGISIPVMAALMGRSTGAIEAVEDGRVRITKRFLVRWLRVADRADTRRLAMQALHDLERELRSR